MPFPLADDNVEKAVVASIDKLISGVFSQKPVILTGEKLKAELDGVAGLYYEQENLIATLEALTDSYPSYSRK